MTSSNVQADCPTLIRETAESISECEGWLVYDVPASWVEWAKDERARRDVVFRNRNIFRERATDQRWVGELGELVLNWWLESEGVAQVEWIRNNPAGQPDFRVNGVAVGAKTVKRSVPFQKDYCGQVTGDHINEPVEFFFFMSYQYQFYDPAIRRKADCSRMWLIGGCTRTHFAEEAVRTEGPATDPCNPAYRIAAGHVIFNARERIFQPPRAWLEEVLETSAIIGARPRNIEE
jgi:hypothetical protein